MNDKPTMGDLAEVLFAAAVAQGRADALKASAVKMQRELEEAEKSAKLQNVLTDTEYMVDFIARWRKSTARRMEIDDRTQSVGEVNAEILGSFDAAESQAINAGAWK